MECDLIRVWERPVLRSSSLQYRATCDTQRTVTYPV